MQKKVSKKKGDKKIARMIIYGSLKMKGGRIDVTDEGVINVHGDMTVQDVNSAPNVCLCGKNNQTIRSIPNIGILPLKPEILAEVVRSAIKIYKKFLQKPGKKKGLRR